MNEEEFLKKIKIYRGIIVLLIVTLFGAIGYSYSLRLDIDALQTKVDYQYDLIINSYIRNIQNSILDKFQQLKR
jgi:hypothetical protein